MRIVCSTIAILALAVAGVAAASTKPTLRLAVAPTIVVQGFGFAKNERLRVTVFTAGDPIVRQLTTTPLGRFTLRLPVRREPCLGGPIARASGRQSGLVSLRLPVRECPDLAPGVASAS